MITVVNSGPVVNSGHVPRMVLSTLSVFIYFSRLSYEVSTIFISILNMKNQRQREGK